MRFLLLALALLPAAGCFHTDEPACAYVCGAGGECPHDYECRADNFCHKVGSTEACGFSDISATVTDSSTAPDASMPADADATDAAQ